jgi:predicted ester cyclase
VSTDENRALIQRLCEAFQTYWHSGDEGLIDPFFAPDFLNHTPGMPPDLAGYKQVMSGFRAALPDLRITAEDLVAEGDKVGLRLDVRGTQTGTMMGIPPTGKAVAISELHLYRIDGGRIVERWALFDGLGLLQQVGAIPTPEAQAAGAS